ncbi:fibronectin type III domain-containing protein [Labedella populi]|uniref:Fibronectin type III domain-containing protein n=1 Tax=Labedella populi TaxID=2498850 RepID=A0A3S5CLY2_9MICO|nr:Ig-like domain-containing protein [Labedella populi]RWZ64311.1 fibronectin type III domain-containing protein [Labedella populi]
MTGLGIRAWLRGRKVTASIVAVSVLVAVPVSFAILHDGFPVTDVTLEAKDVWVTNGTELLAGRLNRQIEELDAAVQTVSNEIDVLQDGETVVLHDLTGSTIEMIDPSFTTLVEQTDIPAGSSVALGSTTLAVLSVDGELWTTDVESGLQLSTVDTDPILELGIGSHVAVSSTGTVFAVSTEERELHVLPSDGSESSTQKLPPLEDVEIAAAGEKPVIFDRTDNRVVRGDGSTVDLPGEGLVLQQSSASDDVALVATGDSLVAVPLEGDEAPMVVDAKVATASTEATDVAAPVNLSGCWHGAWSSSSRYLAVCDETEIDRQDVEPTADGSPLMFRVNRQIIALNNLFTGDIWLVDANMRLVQNWEEVTPPEEDEGEEGDEKASRQSFEDTIAERTDTNRAPLARDDDIGARPGRSTVLPVLDNDTDPDGDVLTVISDTGVSESDGTLEYIGGGRALQFTPAESKTSGTISLRYTVSDGRSGGVSTASLSIRVVPYELNEAPAEQRVAASSVESGQTVSYNVLTDWRDPDGDDIYLKSAASEAGDRVRFSPDGFITVTHSSGQLGVRDIVFVVSDGTTDATGQFALDAKPAGSMNPVGTPDFVDTFAGQAVELDVLDNDVSPSGAPLALVGAEALTGGLGITPNTDTGVLNLSAGAPGTYYVKYTLSAGPKTSVGLARLDVRQVPEEIGRPIAVRDTLYLRPNEPTSLAVLNNDVSPSGSVLAVRSLTVPDDASSLSVELLGQSVVRVTANEAVDRQLQFSYTLSDGSYDATTTVTVVPVAPLTKHQAPILEDDVVKVRAGDITSVPVLDNDLHPDNAVMTVDQDLTKSAEKGLSFVTGDRVRYQAPSEPGVYTATYQVTDEFQQKAVGNVLFTVVPVDAENNLAPTAPTLTARVFAGADVEVKVPLDGLDGDGDSVVFDGITGAPQLGLVRDATSDTFVYEANPTQFGTDTFEYRVKDVDGATATGTIKIAVVERPAQDMSPIAVDDRIEVRPGRIVSVPVLANDSDPNDYSIELTEDLGDVPSNVTAEVDGGTVEIEAPDEETSFAIRYTISNGHGGTDNAYVQVRVTEEARIQPPGVEDHVVEARDVIAKRTVDIDLREGASNPGGRVQDLVPSVEGPNAGAVELLEDGTARVTLGDTRTAITYRLTNDVDGLSSAAFVVVPPFSDGLPPVLIEEERIVEKNQTKTWRLSEIAESPTGKDIALTDPEKVSSNRSDGTPNYVNDQTVTFTPAPDYRGPASLTFEVSDGTALGVSLLTMPITVGDPEMKDEAPTFTNPTLSIEADGTPFPIDLRESAAHPNADVLRSLSFGSLGQPTGGIQATLSGSTLTASAPFGVQPGTSTSIPVTVTYREFEVTGQINIRVVASSRPLPLAYDDASPDARKNSTVTVPVIDNDFNPFPDQDLTITAVAVESGQATASISGRNVVIQTGTPKSQSISVIYTIQDATKDPSRTSQGRASVTVTDVPDAPPAPALNASDRNITVSVNPTPANNGSEVTGYTVTRNDGTVRTDCSPGVPCSFAGTNGTTYSFTVTATNGVGESAASASASETAYGTPSAPTNPRISKNKEYADSAFSMTWGAPSDNGGRVDSYNWEFSGGGNGSTGGTSATSRTVGQGSYDFRVQACSPAGCGPWATSNRVALDNKPEATLTVSRGAKNPKSSTGYFYHVEARNFVDARGAQFDATCYGPGERGEPWQITTGQNSADGLLYFDANGNYSGDLHCYNGYKGQPKYVVINDVESNRTDW